MLDVIVEAFDDGATPEEIVQQYPTLRLADVYAVIAYVLRHRADVDSDLQRRRGEAAVVRATNEARADPHGVRARLVAAPRPIALWDCSDSATQTHLETRLPAPRYAATARGGQRRRWDGWCRY